MKRDKILALIAGVAILFAIVCSGIIIVQGIQKGTFKVPASERSERYPHAWELEKTKLEEFSEISIALSYCDLSILPSDGYYLEYRMDGTCEKPQYDVSEGRFHFQEGATRVKYRSGFHLFFNPTAFSYNQEPYYVTLYVPKEQYFNRLTLSDESGNIEINDIQAEHAEISASYGNLEMDSFSGKKLSLQADSGNINLGTVSCDTLDISDEYGNISADSFQAADKATISLASGNLDLSSIETNCLILDNEYGNCSINEVTVARSDISMESGHLTLYQASLGNTEIKNSYGDITLGLANDVSDYNYDLKNEYGSIELSDKKIKADEDGEVYYQKDNGKKDKICITCESGNIEIR